jgi:NTP pyrophosphatase (non-canonical NTP hydrolase)
MDKTLIQLTQEVLKFRDERNWARFHTGKDLAMCLGIESSEVQELFLWKAEGEINLEKLEDEMGDVFYSLLLLADKYSINLEKALINKIEKNKTKYPIEQFRDSNRKYNE